MKKQRGDLHKQLVILALFSLFLLPFALANGDNPSHQHDEPAEPAPAQVDHSAHGGHDTGAPKAIPTAIKTSPGRNSTSDILGFIILFAIPFFIASLIYKSHSLPTTTNNGQGKQQNTPKSSTTFIEILLIAVFIIFAWTGFTFFSNLQTVESPSAATETHATMEAVQGCFGHHGSDEEYEATLTHCIEDVCGEDAHCADEVVAFANQLKTGVAPSSEHDHGGGSDDHSNMEGMDHSNMPGMTSLDDLPLEEAHGILKPEIIEENGETIKIFRIWIEAVKKEIRPGVYVEMWGFNRQIPGPEVRVREGDRVRVYFENKHTFNHTIHWHGQHVDNEMDGVPFVTQKNVGPGETFTYDFIATPGGSHVYHCHVDTDHHLDMGMYGPFIVERADEDLSVYDQDVTWMLSSASTAHKHDHASEPSPYFSGHQQYKVEKDAFMINGKAFPATTPLTVKTGELVKMRLMNIGKEPYSMHIHGHSFTVTHKDGFPVAYPQEMDTLPLLPGERYDLAIKMDNEGAWVFHDHITPHVTNDGFYPGGMIGLIKYDDYSLPEFLQSYFARIAAYNEKATKMGMPPEKQIDSSGGGHEGH